MRETSARAADLADVQRVLNPKPLEKNQLADWFEETADSRDPHSLRRDEIAACLENGDKEKVLVTGHPGTGKSTELVKFQEEHESDYTFISFSLLKEAQLSQASIEALLVLVVEALVSQLETLEVKLNEKSLKPIYEWFSEAFEIKEKDVRMGMEMGGTVDTQNTWLGKLWGASFFVKSDIKTGSQTLHRTITKENRRLSELAYQCNQLIKEAAIGLSDKGLPSLVLIIEDLDKISPEASEAIFIRNPAPIKDLGCRAIFTAPISLLCNPRATSLDANFRKIGIPMIKISDREGSRCQEGYDVQRRVLERRLDLALVESDALELAIEKTAGVLRHLFEVLAKAAETVKQAIDRNRRQDARITSDDVRYGLNRLKAELVQKLGVAGLPKEYEGENITTEQMLNRLRELSQRPRAIEPDLLNLLLLQGHAIIEYNGDVWHRVHPLIEEHLEETK